MNKGIRRHDKFPRTYAFEIYKMESKELRSASLKKVPEEIRGWVKYYVVD